MSAVTAGVVAGARVTSTAALSRAPAGMVTEVAPPAMLPLVTFTGSTMSNGAPAGTAARKRPCPAARRVTSIETACNSRDDSAAVSPANAASGSRDIGLSPFVSVIRTPFRCGSPANTRGGRLVRWLSERSTALSARKPENTPSGRVVKTLPANDMS